MSLSQRTLMGFGAALAAIAFVAIAGLTAPTAKTTLHASSDCPDALKTQRPLTATYEAERPV
jgi:hypothetical protein